VINNLTPLRVGDHHPRPATPTPTRPARTPTPAQPMHQRPRISSDGPELSGAPPASQPVAPSETAPSRNSTADDRPTGSPSRTDDDERDHTGSRTPSPTRSGTEPDR
jgi:hypothetical protein